MTAALDPRVKCAVALAPVADGAWWLRHLWLDHEGEAAWSGFLDRVSADRRASLDSGASQLVPRRELLVDDSREIADRYPQFAKNVALISGDDLLDFRPRLYVSEVGCPLRIVHSSDDESVPVVHAEELYTHAKCERDLSIVRGSPHCFWLGPRFEEVLDLTVNWVFEHLASNE